MIALYNFNVKRDLRDCLIQLPLRLAVKTFVGTFLTHTPAPNCGVTFSHNLSVSQTSIILLD